MVIYMQRKIEMNVGIQPLDKLMDIHNLSNNDIVVCSQNEPITHKQVQKARRGRRLTIKIQQRILKAFNICTDSCKYKLNDLFNYIGKKDL